MEPKDKILVGILSALSALLIAFAALLPSLVPKYIHLCPKGQIYDKEHRMCRKPCPGEGKGGQLYDAVKETCSCSTVRPIYDETSMTCIPQCDAHETYDFKAAACIPDAVNNCLPTPSVTDDGTILYPSHFPRGDNACSPGTADELQSICVVSGFDGYKSGKCFKQRDCSEELCTADYCTSDSVLGTLGPIYKQARADDAAVCENPTEADVGDMCTAQPSHVWKPPNCYKTTLQRTIRVDFDDNYPPTTELIQGVLQHPLLNMNDDPILYTWTLRTPEGEVVGEGQCSVASCGVSAESQPQTCAAFAIVLSNTASGAHLLDIQGRPSWDSSLVLYTTAAPETVYLLPAVNTPGTTPLLNPHPSIELAQELAKNQSWVQDTLKTLQAQDSRLIVQNIPADVELALADAPGLAQSALIVGCVKAYCRADQGQVKQKLVILAWPAISPADIQAAQCAPDLTVVKYMLLRIQAGAVVELIGPSSQPLVKTSTVSFVDVLEINSNVQYILAAYLVSPEDGLGTDYSSSACKSQQVFVAVRVGDYSAEFCKTIAAPLPGVLPPYYWRDSRTGMCEWAVNVQGARDYYCMFDQGTSGNPAANLDLGSLYFATSTETCEKATKSSPQAVQTWRDQYCLPVSAGGNYPNSACISGVLQNSGEKIARAKCTNSILGGEVTQSDFRARLDQVVEYYKKNNVFPDVEDKVAALTGTENQDALWKASYYSCGPADMATTWGTSPQKCNGDQVCELFARTSGCDRNYCMPWQPEGGGSYVQPRVCYPPSTRIDGSNSPCCNKLGTYSLTTSTTGDRGKCTNCGIEFGGAQCTENKCLGVDCNGSGDCVINQQTGEAQCLCFANYFNVQKQTHKMSREDCERSPTSPPGCPFEIVVDGKVVPNPECKVDRFKCRCPEPAVDMKACIRNADPAQNVYSVRTGCPIPCAYGKTPSSSNPYCFRNPDANDFTCTTCGTDGAKCSSTYSKGPYECCSGRCENHWTDWTHTAQDHKCTGP